MSNSRDAAAMNIGRIQEQSKKLVRPLAAFIAVISTPVALSGLDSRGVASHSLVIQPPKGSPAFAAYEDLYLDDEIYGQSSKPMGGVVTLTSGQQFSWTSRHPEVAHERQNMDQFLAGLPMGGRLEFKGLKIRADSGTDLQPEGDLKEIQTARLEYDQQPLMTPMTLEQKARKLIAQYKDSDQESNQRILLSGLSGSKILVKKPSSPAVQQVVSVAGAPTKGDKSNKTVAVYQPEAPVRWLKPSSPVAPPRGGPNHHIYGQLELDGGLAYTGREGELRVFHNVDGVTMAYARLNGQTGEFTLNSSVLSGELIAELRDENDQVIGRGITFLSHFPYDPNKDIQIDRILVTPIYQESQVEVISAYSTPRQKIPVRNAKVEIEGFGRLSADESGMLFTDDALDKSSSYIVRATAPQHWGSLYVGSGSRVNQVKLFSNSMMEAFMQITAGENAQMAKSSGVIWGRVVVDGKAVTNAQVEIAGLQNGAPIYFNKLMLPDRFLEGTGDNGLFAFIWVNPGLQQIRVKWKGKYVPAQIVPVELGHVSYVEFQINDPIHVPVRIYDPHAPSQKLKGQLSLADYYDQEVPISGQRVMEIERGNGLMALEADAGSEYEWVRALIEKVSEPARIPVPKREFVNSLVARRRLNLESGSGIALGFKVREDFTVQVGNASDNKIRPEVVYFDAAGRVNFDDKGLSGGGFAVFNLPQGMHTVAVKYADSGKQSTRVTVVDDRFVSVMSFDR